MLQTHCTPIPLPTLRCAACHEMKSAWVKPYTLQQAFQIPKRTKHFGINTMYSVFSNIQNIHFQFFAFSFYIYIVKFVVKILPSELQTISVIAQARRPSQKLSSGASSCARPGGRSGRSCGCTPRTGTAWPRYASGNGASAHPSVRTSSHSLPRCICMASHLRQWTKRRDEVPCLLRQTS